MNIKVIKEKLWYSANISNLWIFTQWDNFEELLRNLKEAIELYQEDGDKNITYSNKFNEFNLVLK
jgi:hypothetical protein